MLSIEYKYRTLHEILKLIEKYNNFSNIELGILFFIIVFLYIGILYIFPIINVYIIALGIEKKNQSKKLALKQILIQREIEEELQKEIEIENKKIV
ncbi:MAG: hypothetical protein PHE25_01325 [Candidatus Gracilibacteria bacterium]|nr:hypothetical protein [Candidatus Gracilibacteria bacterium]